MKKIIYIILILFAVVSPSACFAEESSNVLGMEELSIQVMPEYTYHPNDKKKNHAPLLIGYQGSMVNNSDHPQKGLIEIPLPIKEKNFRIGYVADYSSDLTKTNEIEYSIDREKGTISWTTSNEIPPQELYKFVIEYYTDSLQVNHDDKSLTYHFTSFADIGLVNVYFTQPNQAKKWKLTPAPEEKSHADGKKSFAYHFQNVKDGTEKNFKLTYKRLETKTVLELQQSKNLNKRNNVSQINHLAIGAFGGVSVLSIGALAVLIKRRKN
ncbi:hypothetical protein [Bacillus sp. JJ1764]|uniref:hypothetical protein n=1 Tax=Bacillus sp. JJ1764 TaxID=3122964 RepID=UPI0030004B66